MSRPGKKSTEVKSIIEELTKVKKERDFYKEKCAKIKSLYGPDIFNILRGFNAKHILSGYLKNVYDVNLKSKRTINECNYQDIILEQGEIKEPPLWMDHILFHFMEQDVSKLVTILDYELRDNPTNLSESYERSDLHIINLTNNPESHAWFVNLKNPSTYINSQEATSNQSVTFDVLKKKKDIDIRRIHLFYEGFFDDSSEVKNDDLSEVKKPITRAFDESRKLFTTLLLEFFHGIESRVLFIKDYDSLKEVLYKIPGVTESCEDFNEKNVLFLLDFGIYFSKKNGLGSPPNYNHLNGETHVLCADFTAEHPGSTGSSSTKQYSKDKVYDFDNPLIYSIFKNHFLSLWNNEKYESFLQTIIEKHNKVCNCENNDDKCRFQQIKLIKKAFVDNVEILDVLDFWEICEARFGRENIKEMINTKVFINRYFPKNKKGVPINSFNSFTQSDAIEGLYRVIANFVFSDDKNENWRKFNRSLAHFKLRKIQRLENKLEWSESLIE